MTTLQEWTDKVLVINLSKRTDRWNHFKNEMASIGVTNYERFDAHEALVEERIHGNYSCTASHRGCLELIAHNKWERCAVFEDDASVRNGLVQQFGILFDKVSKEIPAEFFMLYLGGGYAEAPKRRISPHIIECGAMMTTSSYVIGWKQAKLIAPHISGIGPIDSLYHKYNREQRCYVVQPRLFVQYPNYSDLTERECNNQMSMEDEHHENMLLEGTWKTGTPDYILDSTITRREIAAPHDIDGSMVIVNGVRYTVLSIELPKHPAPWFRGESCVYQLKPV